MKALTATDPIELTVVAGEPVTLAHGLGREVAGWLVVWSTAAVALLPQDPDADTRRTLTLVPSASCTLRLVLL